MTSLPSGPVIGFAKSNYKLREKEMPSLKYQLRELLASLSVESNQLKDPVAKRRLYLIRAVAESSKDVKKTCEARGVSTDLFYKWSAKLLLSRTLGCLRSISKTNARKYNQTSKRVEKKIVEIRQARPYLGAERISFELKAQFGIECPTSTVGAILKRKGLITQAYASRLTKKHLKRYRRPFPGYLQMDFKYVPYRIETRQFYQLSVIDHHSSWRFIRIYDNRSLQTVVEFLEELYFACPFSIMQIQTDNATEFTDKYSSGKGVEASGTHALDKWCEMRAIEHKLIPIGEKEINGKVENSHRFDDREFFSQGLKATSLNEIRAQAAIHNHYWNELRPTRALQWRAPVEMLADAHVRAYVFIAAFLERYAKSAARMEVINTPNGQITRQWQEKIKKAKKPNRYLQYLDWLDRQKLKLVPPLVPIFSSPSVQCHVHNGGVLA
jgi:transposase InsO family protein